MVTYLIVRLNYIYRITKLNVLLIHFKFGLELKVLRPRAFVLVQHLWYLTIHDFVLTCEM